MPARPIIAQLAMILSPPMGPRGAVSVIPRDFAYRLPLKQAIPIKAKVKDRNQSLLCHSILAIAPIIIARAA